ncbi:MAG: transglutaminase family protein [Alphaproteobacteria bacterium]|jgi:transglutaminase-like putative cysteine protease|nr:transglutaminase family protein [Alphaproteobacteria bacterium]MDP6568048.1 transglutaminase family protein [Alphaproteobacteria bacterium]MDP6815573.1 transglutaminase family protein [Alphaproteobacteria bacterium]
MAGAEIAADDGEDLTPYLKPGVYVDSDHPDVIAFAKQAAGTDGSDLEKAVRIFYAIRDGFRYNPYGVDLTEDGIKGSGVIARNHGFCITKSALMAACCRVVGIPARLGYADVRNHLASKRMLELQGTDLFVFHGFAEIYLEGKWVKATPVFNLSLCDKFGVLPLEFDGRNDSVFHPFDKAGNKHMEYVRDRGFYADVPLAEMRQVFQEVYPQMYGRPAGEMPEGDMEKELEAERQAK